MCNETSKKRGGDCRKIKEKKINSLKPPTKIEKWYAHTSQIQYNVNWDPARSWSYLKSPYMRLFKKSVHWEKKVVFVGGGRKPWPEGGEREKK